MPDSSDISDDIATSATTPASASVDGNSVSSRPISEKIAARNDALAQEVAASNRPGFGLRFQKIKPQYE